MSNKIVIPGNKMGITQRITLLIVIVLLLSQRSLQLQSKRRIVREIKSNALTQVGHDDVEGTSSADSSEECKEEEDHRDSERRKKRSLFSAEELETVLDIHNELRRAERAANMENLLWNDGLALMAEDWAKGCNFIHGQPRVKPSSVKFDPIGQNLYAVTGIRLNVTTAIRGWHSEKKDYDFNTNKCRRGQQCGHYTQVVWGTTREIGCAYAWCPDLLHSGLQNAEYFVCNYGPAGNYEGEKPFIPGHICSLCANGLGWCEHGLCRYECRRPSRHCGCTFSCANCGELDEQECKCKCKPGWFGNACTDRCENKHQNCNRSPGWPPYFCDDARYGSEIRKKCPAMCGVCEVSDSPVTCSAASLTTVSRNRMSLIYALIFILFLLLRID